MTGAAKVSPRRRLDENEVHALETKVNGGKLIANSFGIDGLVANKKRTIGSIGGKSLLYLGVSEVELIIIAEQQHHSSSIAATTTEARPHGNMLAEEDAGGRKTELVTHAHKDAHHEVVVSVAATGDGKSGEDKLVWLPQMLGPLHLEGVGEGYGAEDSL